METINIGVIIQARLGSTRLPGKVLLPFYNGQSILGLIIKRFQKINLPLLLATSDQEQDNVIAQFGNQLNIPVYRGSENNVVLRFIEAANTQNIDLIVRVCADNPFLSLDLFEKLLNYAEELKFDFDYLSYKIGGKPAILTHYGVTVEFVQRKALEKILQLTNKKLYLEHVTNYLYNNPSKFKVCWKTLSKDYFISDDLRLTIDTEADFGMVSEIYQALQEKFQDVEITSINSYLSQNPHFLIEMSKQIEKNTK